MLHVCRRLWGAVKSHCPRASHPPPSSLSVMSPPRPMAPSSLPLSLLATTTWWVGHQLAVLAVSAFDPLLPWGWCMMSFSVNMPDPIWLRSVGQKRAQWWLDSGWLPGWIHLAKTWHGKPWPNQIQAGFARYDPHRLWKNAAESESGKLVEGR